MEKLNDGRENLPTDEKNAFTKRAEKEMSIGR